MDLNIELSVHAVSDLHSLIENYLIDEEYTGTKNLTEITRTDSEPDLGTYCIQNPNIFKCQRTLGAITERIDSIVNFNDTVRRKAAKICKLITDDLVVTLTSVCILPLKFSPKVYGSFESGLCGYESNVNLHVEYYYIRPHELWEHISEEISNQANSKFSHVRIEFDVSRTRVLKMIHNETTIETVVSYTDEMKLNNSTLMKIYIDLDSNLKPLMLFLKHILILQNLYGDEKISTYQLFWLVIYYFQMKKLLPTVEYILSIIAPKCYINKIWNRSIPHSEDTGFTSDNLIDEPVASLFLGFVGFYKDFNFLRYVISPYVGYAIPTEDFDDWKISLDTEDARHFRFSYVGKASFIKSAGNLQDPTILDRNLFSSVPINVINSFKYVCKCLYRSYHGSIFSENDCHMGLPILLPTQAPVELIQCAKIFLGLKSTPKIVDLKRSMILAIRQLMENFLKLTLVRTTSKKAAGKRNSGTVIYFDYRIDAEKCDTDTTLILNRIIRHVPGNDMSINFNTKQIENAQYRVYIVCEISKKDSIRLLVEGTDRLVKFLNAMGPRLLRCILRYQIDKKIVS